MRNLTPLLLLSLAVGCSGSGGSAVLAPAPPAPTQSPVPGPTTSASAGPVQSPTAKPSVAPTATASPTPTLAPTATPVPLALRVVGGAPVTATLAQLSVARRAGQAGAHTQAQGVTNGLPILVESSGMIAAWAGNQAVWATNAQTQQDIPEVSGTITPSGNLPINNPGFSPLSCLGSVSAVCIVHPMGFVFGTSSANGKPVGKQTLTIAFADGTTGTTFDYVYDGWNLPCNAGWAYVGGVPVAQATRATSDVYADCVAGNIVLTQGGLLIANPSQDQYGRTETIMPTITAGFIVNSLITNVPMVAISPGTVLGIQTRDGGFAKIYFTSQPSSTTQTSANGMALRSQTDGSFAF